jgi:hypothetical protein
LLVRLAGKVDGDNYKDQQREDSKTSDLFFLQLMSHCS